MLFFGQNKFLANFVRNSYIISDNLCEFLYSKAVVSNIGLIAYFTQIYQLGK